MPPSTDEMAENVVPSKDPYNTYLFAFTPECSNGCEDGQFGVKGLSSDVGFLFKDGLDESPLAKAIVKSLDGVVGIYDIDRFLQLDYPAADIQTAVMEASMPLAQVYIFCPPCLSAIAAAIALCRCMGSIATQWLVRVDHRLGCKCCPDSLSGLSRIEMIADTVADVESGNHWAKPISSKAEWLDYIDRTWLEQLLYNEQYDGRNSTKGSSKSPSSLTSIRSTRDYAGLRQMLTRADGMRGKSTAVILADVENGAWILNSKPFPVVERQPRAGEMYKLNLARVRPSGCPDDFEHSLMGTKEKRTFFGTFPAKGLLKRRRDDSPPPSLKTASMPASDKEVTVLM